MKAANENTTPATGAAGAAATTDDAHAELVETWVSALLSRLPQLCACVVVLDGENECFQWFKEDTQAVGTAENLVGAASLARRSKSAISTHDRRYLTIAVKMSAANSMTGAGGGIAVMLDAPASLRDSAVRELEQASVWFSYLYRKLAKNTVLQPEDLAWLYPLIAPGSDADIGKQGRLFNRLLGTTNKLAHIIAVNRVAIGLCRGKKVIRVAVSGQREFSKRSPLQRRLCDTMSESYRHWLSVQDREPVRSDHGLTVQVPITEGSDVIGVMMLDKRDGRKFSDAEVADLLIKGQILGSFLALAKRAERDPLSAVERAAKRFLPTTVARKVLYVSLAALFFAGTMIPLPHKISADAVIEGEMQRALVAPLDTYLEQVHVQAGSNVVAGELLANFATEDLSLELLKWQSERARKQKAKRDLAARQERSKLRVLEAEIAQANAEIALVETRIAKSKLHAPVDGVIVSGDLNQRLGAPVERGEVLFEIVPNGDYHVMLLLDEQQVRNVETGNLAHLKLNAFPGQTIPLEVFRITPVNEVTATGNYFVAYGRLVDSVDQQVAVRPGMQGVAKIEVGNRPAFVNWTESFYQWASLKAWQWFGFNFGR